MRRHDPSDLAETLRSSILANGDPFRISIAVDIPRLGCDVVVTTPNARFSAGKRSCALCRLANRATSAMIIGIRKPWCLSLHIEVIFSDHIQMALKREFLSL